jgi:Flp pilus assembly pilin Flp
MNRFTQNLSKFLKDESGQDLVEYGFILAFLTLVGLATMKGFAATLTLAFSGMGNKIVSVI